MKREFRSEIIQFRGRHYDFGLFQGESLRDSLLLKRRARQWHLYKPKFLIDLEDTKAAYQNYAPGLWEELQGLSEGLKLPLEDTLRNFGGYRVPGPKSGCSTVITGDYLIRNYDYLPNTYDGRYVFFQPTDYGYATVGPSQRIVGRMDGMNEHGLSIAYNFTHRKKPGLGFVCHSIGRIVLEQAKNVEEAVHLLKEIPHRHSFTYLVLDREGKKQTIEATPRKVEVHDRALCTNHFHIQKDENRKYTKESVERLGALERHWQEDLSFEESFDTLNDPTKGIFVEEYKNWSGTIHTSGYRPKELSTYISLGIGPSRKKISFADWLEGRDLDEKYITGKLQTDLPFANME